MFAATGILQRNRSEPRRPIASLLDLPTLSVQSQQMRRKQTRCQAQVGIRPVPEEPKAELLVEEPLHEEGEDGESSGDRSEPTDSSSSSSSEEDEEEEEEDDDRDDNKKTRWRSGGGEKLPP